MFNGHIFSTFNDIILLQFSYILAQIHTICLHCQYIYFFFISSGPTLSLHFLFSKILLHYPSMLPEEKHLLYLSDYSSTLFLSVFGVHIRSCSLQSLCHMSMNEVMTLCLHGRIIYVYIII